MEVTKRDVIRTFTILSLAASVIMGFQYLGAPAYEAVYNWIMSQEAGGASRLSWLFRSEWTEILVQYVFLMGFAHIPAYLLMCWLPKDRRKTTALPAKDFFVTLIACMGAAYLLNFVGILLNLAIGSVTGRSLFDMNPVMEMSMDMTPDMILYTVIVGPFMEELMFRGMLLKRARVFGDRTAVVFTAVMFGLMHGNLAQFLYAVGIGLIFGYVAVKTNGIRYTVLMHMLVNSYSVVLVLLEEVFMAVGGELLIGVFAMGVFGVMIGLIIAAIAILRRYGRHWYLQLTHHNGVWTPDRLFVYLNPGFFVYLLLCMVEFLAYML